MVATLAPVPASLSALIGLPIRILKSASSNSGAVTLNVNALGVKNVKTQDGNVLMSGQLPANALLTVIYDGTQFQALGVKGGYISSTQTPATSTAFSEAHNLVNIPAAKSMFVKLICITTDLGYAVGDEVQLVCDSNDTSAVQPWMNATNIGWGSGGTSISIRNKAASATSSITAAKWTIQVGVLFF